MKPITQIQVKDVTWDVFYLDSESFNEHFDNKTAAVTLPGNEKKVLIFREDELRLGVVIHELFHAYVAGMHLDSAHLKLEQFEDVVAEFLEDYAEVLLTQSKKLLKVLRGKTSQKDTVSRTRRKKS